MSSVAWVVAGLALAGATGTWLWARRVVTRRAALLAAYHESEARNQEQLRLLTMLLDASPLAVILCTDGGSIVFENEAARRMFFEGQKAEGQNFLRLVADGPEAFRAALLGASDEIVGLTVEGQRETYHFARRAFDYLGQAHTLLVVRPMTREVARHDIEVLRKVVRLLSHEVNNSLAPVSSLVHSARQILATRDRLERLERVFATIEERARHLSDFIAGYAGLARLPRPTLRPVEWGALLARLSMLYPEASLSAPAGAQGFFDPGQIEQALINLLRNANEAGGPNEEVRLEVVPLAESGAELHVLDRGPGFSPEALEHALLPFYTTKPGGSGVGLALVREIVQAHEGRLTLGARAGGGASITLWLPGLRRERDPARRARLTLTRA